MTEDMPKMLVPVAGRPIAEHQVDWLLASGAVDGLIFACGYKWERIKEHFGSSYKGVKVEYSVEEETLGTGGAIKRAISQNDIGDEFIALNGDIITDLPLQRLVEAHHSTGDIAATMLVVPYRSRFGVVRIDKLKMVRGFEEKPAFPDVWINGGVYVLNSRKCAKSLPEKGDIERETFPKMVGHGELMSYPYYGEWYIIDSVKDLKDVEVALKSSP
jgi:NDP-sugar pyrophosphorylase family protein